MSDRDISGDLGELETPPPLPRLSALMRPHRLIIIAVAIGLLVLMAVKMRWDWLPEYAGMLATGLWVTVLLLIASTVLGLLMAIPLGLVQVTGPFFLAWPAKIFCTIIRGTPLLLQLWLLYYGLGSLFPGIPGIRESFIWPYLREAWPYGLLALTLSYAGYEGEVMRGAFAGVPNGELEAARAYGMGRWKVLTRIWLPRAIHRALPTLAGETVVQLKSTPLVATITVIDLYSVVSDIRQSTFLTYEPLLFLAFLYLCLTGILVTIFRYYERKIPTRGR
ncbi:ABC transporter permease [Martelella soudanensis]|uniref:ABC transporter permease n=1 Tax=unclassified Martelella TaxID=2629616 RepID=UPI0015DF774E|nr:MULTISPECIES: ABC transporter permease subunit [unclassified Martelella]